MGLTLAGLEILLEEHRRQPFYGDLLTLGKQDVFIRYDDLQHMAAKIGVTLSSTFTPSLASNSSLTHSAFMSDVSLSHSLGFSSCTALDVSDYEQAEYLFDLNEGTTPDSLCESFDVIIDGGTLEHIFHVPNALRNIFNLLRQEGRIVHFSPFFNNADHGFYMFSPTLFQDFYTANQFEINCIKVLQYTSLYEADGYDLFDYRPHRFATDLVERTAQDGCRKFGIACIATKKRSSTGARVPQQSRYVNTWRNYPDDHD